MVGSGNTSFARFIDDDGHCAALPSTADNCVGDELQNKRGLVIFTDKQLYTNVDEPEYSHPTQKLDRRLEVIDAHNTKIIFTVKHLHTDIDVPECNNPTEGANTWKLQTYIADAICDVSDEINKELEHDVTSICVTKVFYEVTTLLQPNFIGNEARGNHNTVFQNITKYDDRMDKPDRISIADADICCCTSSHKIQESIQQHWCEPHLRP